MKIKELRELSVEELISRGRDLRKEVLNARVQQAAGQGGELRAPEFAAQGSRPHADPAFPKRRLGMGPGAPAAKPAKASRKGAPLPRLRLNPPKKPLRRSEWLARRPPPKRSSPLFTEFF